MERGFSPGSLEKNKALSCSCFYFSPVSPLHNFSPIEFQDNDLCFSSPPCLEPLAATVPGNSDPWLSLDLANRNHVKISSYEQIPTVLPGCSPPALKLVSRQGNISPQLAFLSSQLQSASTVPALSGTLGPNFLSVISFLELGRTRHSSLSVTLSSIP